MPRDAEAVQSRSQSGDVESPSSRSALIAQLSDAVAAVGTRSPQQDLQRGTAERRLYARAIRMLTARGCSCAEMRVKLRASLRASVPDPGSCNGEPVEGAVGELVDEGLLDRVLSRLERAGYLDDAEYAQSVARSRLERGASRVKVLRELARRGIEEPLAQDALARALVEVVGPEGACYEDDQGTAHEQERCRELGRLRLARLHDLPLVARQRRLAAYLGRRGYASDLVHATVRELVGEQTVDARLASPSEMDEDKPDSAG